VVPRIGDSGGSFTASQSLIASDQAAAEFHNLAVHDQFLVTAMS
jgi:hypothetical protein